MKTVTVELTEGEVRLIAYFIEERARIFSSGRIPGIVFGDTKVGQKMADAKLKLEAIR